MGVIDMPGPAPQERKHGRTPNASGDWREYDDVPFEGAPPMPAPPGRRKTWHRMAVRTWQTASVMPHCKDWRDEDWLALEVLMLEVHRYYSATGEERPSTAQMTEIRRQRNALGIGEQGRREQKIRYKQKVEPGLPGDGPAGAREVIDDGQSKPAGKVVPLRDRKKSITGRGSGGRGQGESATG
jgi:hypothetical protein